MSEISYEVAVTPTFEDGTLEPSFEFLVYRMVPAGICGPFSTTETVRSIDEVDRVLGDWGYERTEPFGSLSPNGFSRATIVKVA